MRAFAGGAAGRGFNHRKGSSIKHPIELPSPLTMTTHRVLDFKGCQAHLSPSLGDIISDLHAQGQLFGGLSVPGCDPSHPALLP